MPPLSSFRSTHPSDSDQPLWRTVARKTQAELDHGRVVFPGGETKTADGD